MNGNDEPLQNSYNCEGLGESPKASKAPGNGGGLRLLAPLDTGSDLENSVSQVSEWHQVIIPSTK